MRVDNTAWCSCTKCAALPTEHECCCCRELAHIRHIFSDVEGLQCITDHPEFVGACLNPLTLRIALVGVMATRGDLIHLTGDCVMQTVFVTILFVNATYMHTHVHACTHACMPVGHIVMSTSTYYKVDFAALNSRILRRFGTEVHV